MQSHPDTAEGECGDVLGDQGGKKFETCRSCFDIECLKVPLGQSCSVHADSLLRPDFKLWSSYLQEETAGAQVVK